MKKSKFVQHRRKREGRTDYRKRLRLLTSKKLRLVVRKSNKNTIAQIVSYEPQGDKVLVGVNTRDLSKLNWKNSTSSIPAAYLLGMLLAKKSLEKGYKEAVLDLGMQISTKGSRLYAVLKGAIDGGLSVPHSDDILPSEDRLNGTHINEKVAKDIEEVKKGLLSK